MFDNIGEKIKYLAVVICWLGIIASGIACIALWIESGWHWILPLLIAIGGSLVSWTFAFFIYGFGQLIENTDILVAKEYKKSTKNNPKESKDNVDKKAIETKVYKKDEKLICPNCGKLLSITTEDLADNEYLLCPICNRPFETKQFK